MAKRERRPTPPGDFEDPLQNYDPPVYADEFERSLCEDPVTVIRHQPVTAVRPTATVEEVVALMTEYNIASVVVVENDKPIGIFSERDVLNRVVDDWSKLRREPVEQVMTRDPVVVRMTDTPAVVLNQMDQFSFRHVPIVDESGKLTGFVGARRVIEYLQQHFEDASEA